MERMEQYEKLILIECRLGSKWLNVMIEAAVDGTPYEKMGVEDLTYERISGSKVILAYDLNPIGFNHELNAVLEKMHHLSLGSGKTFQHTVFGLLVTSPNDQFTKSSSRSVIHVLNTMGIEFLGQPIVEATRNLENLSKWKKNLGREEADILGHLSRALGEKIRAHNLYNKGVKPTDSSDTRGLGALKSERKIVVIHASDRKTSNTLLLWDMVMPSIRQAQVEEIYLAKEVLNDCKGCLFETCMRFATEKKCFFDDFITKTVLPAVELADVVVWICPNYNDTIGARMMAVINRLTVLYRRVKFDQKLMYAIIVSGNSGGDCVSSQLIGALNINKGFHLPGNFALIETANAPRSILSVRDVDSRAEDFARAINKKIEDFF